MRQNIFWNVHEGTGGKHEDLYAAFRKLILNDYPTSNKRVSQENPVKLYCTALNSGTLYQQVTIGGRYSKEIPLQRPTSIVFKRNFKVLSQKGQNPFLGQYQNLASTTPAIAFGLL